MLVIEKIPSNLEVIPTFISTLIERLKKFPISDEEIFDIRLSLSEALINAVKHGNRMNPGLSVEVRVEIKDKELTIRIKDQGRGFDFKGLPDPTKGENLNKGCGRGVFLVRQLMDKVEFFDRGSGIIMRKTIK